MKRITAAVAAAMMVCGLLVSGCEQEKEEPKPTPGEQKPAGEQAPAKKSPVGC